MRSPILPLVLVLLGAAVAPLGAQGVLVPRCDGCRPLRGASLPVQSVELSVTVEGQVATTHVTQVFRNDTDRVLEGVFFFPLPAGASLSEFALWEGDRRLVGEVRPREEARRIYDEIVRRVRDPGLLEYAGDDLLQASIFPIPARSTKKLEITFTQVLRAEGGTVGYRYPLGRGRNAAPPERVSGRVELRTAGAIGAPYSPTHSVDYRPLDGHAGGRVSFETDRGQEPRDFQLFWRPARAEVEMSLFTHRLPGQDGYFLLLMSPGEERQPDAYAAKDVVFVLDVSGSMAEDDKIGKAKRALVFGLRSLGPRDRFNVIAFSGDTRRFETGLVAADAGGKARGVAFVEGLRAAGGTNINDAMVEALAQFPTGEARPRQLVFLTDGLPTIGVTPVEGILTNVRGARREGTRIFPFGVGYDVNTRLLDRVAAENGGVAEYVKPEEDLEQLVSAFFAKVSHPVLTNLRLDLGSVAVDRAYPRDLPDLFRGGQVTVVGRYRNERDLEGITARLSGNASPTRTFAYPGLRFPRRNEANDWLPRLWAVRRVGWLMEQIRGNGENRELRDEVTELGTRFGIVTPYTSFLATDGSENAPGAAAVRIRGASPLIQARAAGQQALAGETGQAALEQSRAQRRMQDAVSLDALVVTGAAVERRQMALDSTGRVQPQVQIAGGRAFQQRDGVWQDPDLRASLPVTELAFGSDAYYEALRREPRLAPFFAMGEKVDVVLDGRLYRVR